MVDLKLKIPKEFLDEEVRSGYTISRQMKEVWAVQLDLFAEFDRVCRKYNITYIASGGTMLGAVRHKGYIPWDDDMDLMLMRDQYDKLCEVATKEFKHPYFFQFEGTEPTMHRWFARLRNSNTTAIQKMELSCHPQYNQGIFIDIFPMDGVPDDKAEYERLLRLGNHYRKLYYIFYSFDYPYWNDDSPSWKKVIKKSANLFFGHISRSLHLTHWAYKKAESVSKAYSNRATDFISLLTFQMDNFGHALRRSDMNDIIEIDFEFLKMPVPANYDEHLRRKYGDYMTPVNNPNFHGDLIVDTNVGYKDYYQHHQELARK
jgi:lipopolysaccharide cholinephosphotransferase